MDSRFDTGLIDEHALVFASPRRQLMLRYLSAADGSISLDELSRKIAAAESDFGPHSVDADAVRRVHDTLYMTHLPILMEHGVVEYDYQDGVVRATDELDELLEPAVSSEPERHRWMRYYLAAASALTAIVVPVHFGVIRDPIPELPGTALLGVVVLLVLPLLKSDACPCLSSE
jgi:hypothetical protein